MRAAKHTPGPWRVKPRLRSRYPISADRWAELATVWGNEDPVLDAEGKANAKLIAAGPDAVPLIEWMADGYGVPAEWVGKAKAWLRSAGIR